MEKKGTFASPATAFARRAFRFREDPPEERLSEFGRPAGVLLRILEEINDFDQFRFGFIHSRDIFEGDVALPVLIVDLRVTLTTLKTPTEFDGIPRKAKTGTTA